MIWQPPDYLHIPADRLGAGGPVKVRVAGDQQAIAIDFARAIHKAIGDVQEARGEAKATLILPVGPVDQFPILAEFINQQRLDCRDVVLINMDEYLADDGRWLPLNHPLSFRGFMNRKFYDLLEPAL